MTVEAKMEKPIVIKLNKDKSVVLPDEYCNEEYPLSPGVVFDFNSKHYGFIIVSDIGGKITEKYYSTQCPIYAAQMMNGMVNVYEYDKYLSWKFTKAGALVQDCNDKFTQESNALMEDVIKEPNQFMGEARMENPIIIKIAKHEEDSMILKDDTGLFDPLEHQGAITEGFPLSPGVMYGEGHYGFILLIETDDGIKTKYYPTHNSIDAVGTNYSEMICEADVKIYERNKYHPWVFDFRGKLKNESSFNLYLRTEQQYVKELVGTESTGDNDRTPIGKKSR